MKIIQLDKNDVNNIIKEIADGGNVYCVCMQKDYDSRAVLRGRRAPMPMAYINTMTKFTVKQIMDIIDNKNAEIIKIESVDEQTLNDENIVRLHKTYY